MPEFTTEIREIFSKQYVKVFLKDKSRLPEIQITLNNLPSIKNVNITENNETDLTVYANKVYSAEEAQKEIERTLKVIFSSHKADPVIKEDILEGLGADTNSKIIDLIYYFGKNLEKLTSLHSKFDEEGFREYFLPYLNSMSTSNSATGETFNKIGKTDILIQNTKGENIFIAECKVWSGEANVLASIDQLLTRYVTWRDEKLAIIIFNKSVKGFSDIISKAISAVTSHPQCHSFIEQKYDSVARFLFKNPQDPNKIVELHLIMFNCHN